ncbi:hypothetical protein [Gottfriedia luciferensis]|uniref:hypothetical protein n=1 Tax=Gottfriedia luciferensis TaxID=178774 RepID=UPI0013024205|nr:hypothetical protein [Gottfriedia luciferensis]
MFLYIFLIALVIVSFGYLLIDLMKRIQSYFKRQEEQFDKIIEFLKNKDQNI